MSDVKTMHFEGYCPFVLCLETGPHDHPICPECGALNYGNMYCPTCRERRPAYNEKTLARWKEIKAEMDTEKEDAPPPEGAEEWKDHIYGTDW